MGMAKYCQPCPGFKKTTVGDVLLDLVPSTGDVCLLHNYLLTTDRSKQLLHVTPTKRRLDVVVP